MVTQPPMRPARWVVAHGGNYLQPCWVGWVLERVPSDGELCSGATGPPPTCLPAVCTPQQPGVQREEGRWGPWALEAASGGPSSEPHS